jgi:hypothetical protein
VSDSVLFLPDNAAFFIGFHHEFAHSILLRESGAEFMRLAVYSKVQSELLP